MKNRALKRGLGMTDGSAFPPRWHVLRSRVGVHQGKKNTTTIHKPCQVFLWTTKKPCNLAVAGLSSEVLKWW
jgi:hypothetical protein